MKQITAALYIVVLAFAAQLLVVPLSAQATAPQGSEEQMKKELLTIERQIGRANFDCDYEYFAKIEADDFFFIGPNGDTETREQDLAGEKDCHRFGGSYDLDETRVSIYGSTAVFTGRATISGKNKEGKDFTHRNRFTDVFVWHDGRWQMVAGHSSKIPDKK